MTYEIFDMDTGIILDTFRDCSLAVVEAEVKCHREHGVRAHWKVSE